MKKALAIVMVLTLSVLFLAGCGGSTPSTAPATSTPAAGSETTGGGEAPSGDINVAAIFGGAINDGNWNETQYNGLLKIEAAGAKTKFMENVADADAPEAARTYADEKFNLVYLTTNSYQDLCMPIAVDFPETTFVQINGTQITDNFISVRIADEEQGFMQGVIAALLSEKGKVGFVGGMEINPIKLGASGFQQGVDYVNENFGKKVETVINLTGSFTDVNQAKETAIAQIEAGCDVVAPMANDASAGVLEAAEEKGVMAIGAGLGQETSAPTKMQVIVVKDVSIAYDVTFDLYKKGELKTSEVETYGANRGVVYVTDWFAAPSDEVKGQVDEIMTKLANGEITIDLAV